jgi:hypothetical protein
VGSFVVGSARTPANETHPRFPTTWNQTSLFHGGEFVGYAASPRTHPSIVISSFGSKLPTGVAERSGPARIVVPYGCQRFCAWTLYWSHPPTKPTIPEEDERAPGLCVCAPHNKSPATRLAATAAAKLAGRHGEPFANIRSPLPPDRKARFD